MTSPNFRLSAQTGRFSCSAVPADPASAGSVRDEFGRWLRRTVDLDEIRLCDVVLAVNEALANVAEFAYRDRDGVGTFDLEAVHNPRSEELGVTICDKGHWRDSDPFRKERHRGRGIPLMRTLADAVLIDTSAFGTSVRLQFDHVHAGHPVGAGIG